jgi:hypothetical protein
MGKIGYFGHYHFLPNGHRLWSDNEFAGIHESNDPPGEFSIEELLAELEKVKDVRHGKPQSSGKRMCFDLEGGKVKIWSQMVSLLKLSYWHKLKVRHNLDIMHIEKNICESLMVTILNIPRHLYTQLYLNVWNLYMLLFVNYIQFCPGTYMCNLFRP